jgi:putative component of membrane protein insertase Oxa1/YidC/SpoIIIJ protein YidD
MLAQNSWITVENDRMCADDIRPQNSVEFHPICLNIYQFSRKEYSRKENQPLSKQFTAKNSTYRLQNSIKNVNAKFEQTVARSVSCKPFSAGVIHHKKYHLEAIERDPFSNGTFQTQRSVVICNPC